MRNSWRVVLAMAAICAAGTAGATPGVPAAPTHAASQAAPDSVFATIDDLAITRVQVDERAASELTQVRRQEYEARQRALDALIEDAVLGREAAARKLTKEQLIELEVASKLAPVTDADITAYYAQNLGAMRGRPQEAVATQIADGLRAQRLARAQREYVRALRRKYHVQLRLDPPRVNVATGDDPSLGPAKAPVTIIEFSDFQCPYCSRAEQTVEELLQKYGDRVRLVYRDFPLDNHPNAVGAARAGECARTQGKYWEMNRAMFSDASKLSAADLVETARRLGMDAEKFKTCLDSGDAQAEVQKDIEAGRSYGITGTPTFFINGIMIVGARELQAFTDVIDNELERAGR